MKRVFADNYHTLRAKWPNASMIRPVAGGFEGYVFEEKPRTSQDNRYTRHTFMDKG